MINNAKNQSDIDEYIEKIKSLKSKEFLIESQDLINIITPDGVDKKEEIFKKIDEFLRVIPVEMFYGSDVFNEIYKNLEEFYDVANNLFKIDNKNQVISIIDSGLSTLDSIREKLKDYLNAIKDKDFEYGRYSEKIELLIEIESGLLIIDNKFENADFNGFSNDEVKVLKFTHDYIKYILNEFKIRDKYKFWLVLPYDYLNRIYSGISAFRNASKLYDPEYIGLIDDFYSVINDEKKINISRNSLINSGFYDSSFKFEQAKDVAALSRLLDLKIKTVDNFANFEKDVVRKHKDGVEQYNAALIEIQSKLDQSKKYVEEIRSEKGAVLQYSEQLKNTPAIKVYTDIYTNEIWIANFFRAAALIIFSIFSFLSLICLSILFFGDISNTVAQNLTDTKRIIAKIPFVIAFIVFGFYLAREGEKHRRIANQAKQTEAELTALDSYTTNWDKNDIRDLKIKLADKYFGREVNNSQNSSNNAVVEQMKAGTELIKASTDVVKIVKPSTSKQEGDI